MKLKLNVSHGDRKKGFNEIEMVINEEDLEPIVRDKLSMKCPIMYKESDKVEYIIVLLKV